MFRFNQIKTSTRVIRPMNVITRRPFRANCCGKICEDCPRNRIADDSISGRLISLAKFGIGMTGAVIILGNPFGYRF